MKDYPLEVTELREFEGGHIGFWSKGHQDLIAFSKAVITCEDTITPCSATEDEVFAFSWHQWWRCVPVGPDSPGGVLFIRAKPDTRGSFPVTVVEL